MAEDLAKKYAEILGVAPDAPLPDFGLERGTGGGWEPPAAYPREEWEAVSRLQGGPAFNFGDAPSFLGGFIKTAIHGGTSGLIGRDPEEAFFDPEAVSYFANHHPIAAIAAEIIGSTPAYLVPFAAPAKGMTLGLRAAKAIPGLKRAATWATAAETARLQPIATSVVKEMARFAPLEIARVAGAALDRPENVPNVLASIAVELPLIGAFGGLAKIMRASSSGAGRPVGNEQQLQNAFDFYNLNGTFQERLRQTLHAKKLLRAQVGLAEDAMLDLHAGHPEGLVNFDEVISGVQAELRQAIVAQEPLKGEALIHAMVGDTNRGTTKSLNEILTGKALDGRFRIRKFISGKGGFKDVVAVEDALLRSGIAPNLLSHVQYPRHVQTTSAAGEGAFAALLKKSGIEPVGDAAGRGATWIGKEKEGLYTVVVKAGEKNPYPTVLKENSLLKRSKTGKGKDGKPLKPYDAKTTKAIAASDHGSQYTIFKTDNPLVFNKAAGDFQEATLRAFRSTKVPARSPLERSIPTMQMLRKLEESIPVPEDLPGVSPSMFYKFVTAKMGIEGKQTLAAVGRRVDHLGAEVGRWTVHGLRQFRKSKRAIRANSIVRAAYNKSNAKIEARLYGTRLPSKAKSLFGQLVETSERKNSVFGMVDNLTTRQKQEVSFAWRKSLGPSDMQKMGAQKETVDFLKLVDRGDMADVAETEAMQALGREMGVVTADEVFVPKQYHYGLVKSWTGDFRHPVLNMEGKFVGAGSGYTAAEAKKEAEFIVRTAIKDAGGAIELKLGPETLHQGMKRQDDIELAMRMITDGPGIEAFKKASGRINTALPENKLLPRGGALGAMGEIRPFAAQEMKDILAANVIATERANLQIGLSVLTKDEMLKLAQEYPDIAKDLVQRINQRAGRRDPGGLIQRQSAFVDKFLSPYLGKESATKIVNIVNEAQYTLVLGTLNMGFAAVNVLTPLITSMPEIAHLMTIPPAEMAQWYAVSMVRGALDTTPRSMYSISPFRFLAKGVKSMFRPTPEEAAFFSRGITERLVDPQLIETAVGQSNISFRTLAEGKQSWTRFLLNIANWPAAKSEEISRGTSLMMAYHFGKSFAGLEGEPLFQFAREFVERTQFLYQAADRARIITGPMGQAFGLFHNWGMHHIGILADYHGQALRGNIAPLLWTGVGIGAVGGAGALPWMGVANGFSRAVSGKDAQENIYEMMGYGDNPVMDRVSDIMYYGLPGALGLTFQSQTSAFGANPIHDLTQLGSMVLWDRMEKGADLIGSSVDYATNTGRSPITSPEVLDKFMLFAAPRTVYKSWSVMNDNALRSLRTQSRLVSELTVPESFMYAMGIAPLKVEKAFAVSEDTIDNQARRHELVADLGAMLTEARAAGDRGTILQVMRMASVNGVTDNVLRSADSRWALQNEDIVTRNWNQLRTRQRGQAIGAGPTR